MNRRVLVVLAAPLLVLACKGSSDSPATFCAATIYRFASRSSS